MLAALEQKIQRTRVLTKEDCRGIRDAALQLRSKLFSETDAGAQIRRRIGIHARSWWNPRSELDYEIFLDVESRSLRRGDQCKRIAYWADFLGQSPEAVKQRYKRFKRKQQECQ